MHAHSPWAQASWIYTAPQHKESAAWLAKTATVSHTSLSLGGVTTSNVSISSYPYVAPPSNTASSSLSGDHPRNSTISPSRRHSFLRMPLSPNPPPLAPTPPPAEAIPTSILTALDAGSRHVAQKQYNIAFLSLQARHCAAQVLATKFPGWYSAASSQRI